MAELTQAGKGLEKDRKGLDSAGKKRKGTVRQETYDPNEG